MTPRFLVDECTGQLVVFHLRHRGYDVVGVAEEMAQADDSAVIAFAFRENRVLITNDKDFGDKVFRDGYPHAGIVLLRPSDEFPETKLRILNLVLSRYVDRLAHNFTVATERHIRIRRPISGADR